MLTAWFTILFPSSVISVSSHWICPQIKLQLETDGVAPCDWRQQAENEYEEMHSILERSFFSFHSFFFLICSLILLVRLFLCSPGIRVTQTISRRSQSGVKCCVYWSAIPDSFCTTCLSLILHWHFPPIQQLHSSEFAFSPIIWGWCFLFLSSFIQIFSKSSTSLPVLAIKTLNSFLTDIRNLLPLHHLPLSLFP